MEVRRGPDGAVPGGLRLQAYKDLERMRLLRDAKAKPGQPVSSTDWTLIGPMPTNSGASASSGRVSALAVDPRNPDVVYTGGAEGGVWKTTDAGKTWVPLTDNQPSLASGAIALDPSNPDIVYVGTGEGNQCGDCYYGAGILKSTDGGNTWTQLAGPFVQITGRTAFVGGLAVHPTNGQILLAGVSLISSSGTNIGGIYRSTDGAASWTRVVPGTRGNEVFFDAADPNTAWAGVYGGGVFKSTDAGATWTASNGGGATALPLQNLGRVALAQAPSQPGTLYAGLADLSSATSGALLGLYKTTDAGVTWNKLSLQGVTDYCRSQCWYDNVLSVSPTNPNVVYAGGIGLYRSVDAGATWNQVSGLHVDQHAQAWAKGGTRLYLGNDGGVWSANDGTAASVSLNNLNSTLAITEFYPSMSINPADVTLGFGGTQDNNVQRYSGSLTWNTVTCGDGGWTIVDQSSPNLIYATCQNIDLRKSTNGGTSWSSINRGLTTSDRTQFIPPFVADPSNYQRLYFGAFRLYQSTDGGGSWNAVSADLTGSTAGGLTAIAVAPSDPNTVYTGARSSALQVTTNALSATPKFTRIGLSLPVRPVSQIVVDPAASTTIYVTLQGFSRLVATDTQGHIFQSTDGGASFLDISGDLPNVPVNDLVLDRDIPGTFYAATDVGVFTTVNGGLNWTPLGNSLPRVVVMAIRLHRPSRTLRAATHGRSVWDLQVPLPAGANPAPGINTLSPASATPGSTGITLSVNGGGFVAGATVNWNGQSRDTTFVSANQVTAAISAADLAAAGIAQISVTNPAPGGGVSNALLFPVVATPSIGPGAVVNAASFTPGPVAGGSLASLFGSNLAVATATTSSTLLPATLGGANVRVAFSTSTGSGGLSVPLIYVSPTQINFQVPWELTVSTTLPTALQVTSGGIASSVQTLQLTPVAPGIFTVAQSQGAILLANTALLAAPEGAFPGSRPAAKGEVVSIFATGLGAVSNAPATGAPAPSSSLSSTNFIPVVTIGGANATVGFSGLAPGFVGLYQINVTIPDTAPSGDGVEVVLSVNGVTANKATLAVK